MDRGERYEREKKQGIRDESGAMIVPLDAFDFADGYDDAKHGRPSPDEPSLSYEMGRTRWEEDDNFKRDILGVLPAVTLKMRRGFGRNLRAVPIFWRGMMLLRLSNNNRGDPSENRALFQFPRTF